MGIDTKPNISSNKFEQCVTDIMNLSGCTQIYGTLDMESGSTLNICNSAVLRIDTDSGIDKILRSDAEGNATWIELPIKDAVNALTLTDGTVLLGGELIHETEIELNSNLFTISNQNPPFEIGTGFDGGISTISEDSDGKYVAAGAFHNYSGVTGEGLVRLNSDGSRDATLEIGTGFWKTGGSTAVSTHTIQSDGKILVGGSFTQFSGASHSNLIRLNSDGSVDTGFTPPESSLVGVRVIYVKDSGKILVGGDFTNHLKQLNTDGTTDTNFVVGTGFAGGETVGWTFVLDIKEQSDGQLLIAGDYNSYSGITAGHMIRLNPDGSYDDTFDTNPGFDRRVRTISIQTDGKMVVGGEFTGYTDSTFHNASGIAKLNSDATFDSTFDIGSGFTGNTGTEDYHIGVKHILKQVNNQFLVTGYFTWYNGTTANGVIRLNNDASIDSGFDSGTGFNTVPIDAIITSNGKFLLGGNFTTYSGVSMNRIIRLSYYGDIDNQALDSTVIFNGKVVEYGDDYQSHYTCRSLVDKEYIDNLIATGTTNVSGENVTKEITQATHGFAVKDFIGWSGGTYNKAIADGNYDGEFVGLVIASADTNTFSVTQSGYVTGMTSLTTNTTYFLSESTAGLITDTEPTGDGEISKAVLIANSTTSGWVLPYVGYVISTGTTSISTADNGLTVSSGIVGLGGTLCQNTEIDVSTYNLSICNLSGKTTQNNAIFVDDLTGTLVTGVTSSGCGNYSSNSPATCTVGGISSGTVLTGNTLEYLLQEILAPYIVPTFSAFAVNITSPMEVGAGLSGTKTFTWSTTTSGNVTNNCLGICQVGGSVLGIELANDGTEALAIGSLTNTSPTTWTWQITGCSTQDDPFTRNVSKCSIYPYFYGVETCGSKPTVDNTLVNSGTKVVSAVGSSVSVTFNSSSQWTWFAMPASCAARTKWFIAVGNCGFVDRGCATDRYPDNCTLNITDNGGCWSTISYKVYMSDYADSLSDPLAFRTY